MPLKGYYKHGGLATKQGEIHNAIFRTLLAHPHGADTFVPLTYSVNARLPKLRKPKEMDQRRQAIWGEIHALQVRGLLDSFQAQYKPRGHGEVNLDLHPSLQTQEFIRINPVVLENVAKFARSKK